MTAKAVRGRKFARRFSLTEVERMLLLLYRTVPQDTRARVGEILFDAWTHGDDDDKAEMQRRYKEASRAFDTGPLLVEVFDHLCAGGVIRAEDVDGAR